MGNGWTSPKVSAERERTDHEDEAEGNQQRASQAQRVQQLRLVVGRQSPPVRAQLEEAAALSLLDVLFDVLSEEWFGLLSDLSHDYYKKTGPCLKLRTLPTQGGAGWPRGE